MVKVVVLLCASLVSATAVAESQVVNVAVAANFAQPLKAFASDFEQKTGIRPIITVGSSGVLFAQISHGAPFDIFLSADRQRPEQLVKQFKAEQQNLRTYAKGRLALVYRHSAYDSLEDFFSAPTFSKPVAMANPKLAPYGAAAEHVITQFSAGKPLAFSLVKGKNVLQAYQYFQSGNVDTAFVAWSLVKQQADPYFLIPAKYHAPIEQGMVLIKGAEHPYAARRFMQYLLSPDVQKKLKSWGYQPVNKQHGEMNGK